MTPSIISRRSNAAAPDAGRPLAQPWTVRNDTHNKSASSAMVASLSSDLACLRISRETTLQFRMVALFLQYGLTNDNAELHNLKVEDG